MMSWILIKLIRAYQYFLSPWFGSSCRFNPTCSHYAIECIKCHGSLKGVWLTVKRIGRCHPWSSGGHDPVPPNHCNKHR